MFQEHYDRAVELIEKGDHKHGGQELYEAILEARDADEMHVAQELVERELARAGWRQRGRYKELKRVAGKHLSRRLAAA